MLYDFQNLELKMCTMCEEDKAHCDCIISETNVSFISKFHFYSSCIQF